MKLKSLFILSIISLLADDIWAANVDFDATIAQLGLKDNVTTDWSDSAEIKLPEPTLAYVNILSPEQVMPQSPQDLHNVEVEMYDGQGNYFRKRAVTHAQGSTSLSFEKKNFAANFCDDEWLEKATPNIKFGHFGFYRTVANQQPTIKPYRAYLTYDEGDNMQRAAYFFDHQEGNSTNGIEVPYDESTFFEQAGFTHPEGMTFYSVSGQPLQGPRRGINIVRYPDGRQMKINVK